MKRYLAFYGKHYEEQGGMNDCIGDFDNVSDAISKCEKKEKEEESHWYNITGKFWTNTWADVYDQRLRKYIWTSYSIEK